MEKIDFSISVEISQPPKKIFECLLQVSKWWSKDFAGNSATIGDEFVIHHPGAHYSKQRLTEFIPDRRIVWLVTESKLDWLTHNKSEWTNTQMIFELESADNGTVLRFTHEGLVPDIECYERCREGWTTVILERLYNFIMTGKEI